MASFIKFQRKRQHPGRPVGGRAPKPSPEGRVAGRVRRQDEGGRAFEAALEKTQPTTIFWSGYPIICCHLLGVGYNIHYQNCQKGVQLRTMLLQICIIKEKEYLFECSTSGREEATVMCKNAYLCSRMLQ